jgi:hypothetical protein
VTTASTYFQVIPKNETGRFEQGTLTEGEG